MAVTGRKVSAVLCEPCVNDGYDIVADGYCKECEENMCSKCFQHHRKGKVCRNHVFLNGEYKGTSSSTEASNGLLDKCPKHLQENVKFYCPTHEVIGCGDCIIREHKSCEVSYISDITMGLDEKEYTNKVVKEIENCCNDLKEHESKIQRTIENTETTHKKFTHDAECFKQEMMNTIEKLAADACEQASRIKAESLCALQKLEIEVSDILKELFAMKGNAESMENESKDNFISAIRLKSRLKEIEKRFAEIDKMNKAKVYTFLKPYNIENAIEKCKAMDLIQRKPDAYQSQDDVEKEYRSVTLKKGALGLGLVIQGGHDGHVLTISRINSGTPAAQSGNIFVGDEIVSINNVDVINKSHSEALDLIRKHSNNNETTFVLCRPKSEV